MTVSLEDFKEVTKDEFYGVVGKLNVHPRPVGEWPYESHFKTPAGQVMGVVVSRVRDAAEWHSMPESERERWYVRESLLRD